MLSSQDPPFQLRNPAFVPDKRCPGWFTTNIVGFNGPVSLESDENAHKLLTRNVQDFLNLYNRYRVYINNEGLLILSVRQENVNQIGEKLLNFRLEKPSPEDFECVKIAIDNAPFYRNLMEEFVDMIHGFELKKDLLSLSVKSKAEMAKFHFVADLVNTNRERVLLEYKTVEDQDMFIKTIIRSMFLTDCACKMDCMWRSYENLWVFQEMIEKLGHRSEQQKRKDFGPLFVMTKEVFNRRKTEEKQAYVESLNEHLRNYRYTSFSDQEVINEMTDNTPIRNIDVVRGRGLWLSHSRTYTNWPGETVKEEEPKPDVRVHARVELLEEILKTIEEKSTKEKEMIEGNGAAKADKASSSSTRKKKTRKNPK